MSDCLVLSSDTKLSEILLDGRLVPEAGFCMPRGSSSFNSLLGRTLTSWPMPGCHPDFPDMSTFREQPALLCCLLHQVLRYVQLHFLITCCSSLPGTSHVVRRQSQNPDNKDEIKLYLVLFSQGISKTSLYFLGLSLG